MAYLDLNEPPVFTENIHKTEEDDLITADLENDIKGKLLNNDRYLNNRIDGLTEHYTVTISVNWDGEKPPYTQEIAVPGIRVTDNPIIDIILSNDTQAALFQEKNWGCVSRIVTKDDGIIVYCNKKRPTVALPVQIIAVR